MMQTFSIGAAVKRGWSLFKSHKGVLVGSLLVLMILQGIAGNNRRGAGYYHSQTSLTTLIALVLALAVTTIVKIGWLKLLLMIEDGKRPEWTEIFAHPDLFVKFILATFLYAIGTAFLCLLFLVPGIYFAIRYCFVPLLVIDTKLGIGEAFTKSAEMTKGHTWQLLGLFLISLCLVLLGALVFLVGLLVAIPVVTLAYIHVYRSLSKAA